MHLSILKIIGGILEKSLMMSCFPNGITRFCLSTQNILKERVFFTGSFIDTLAVLFSSNWKRYPSIIPHMMIGSALSLDLYNPSRIFDEKRISDHPRRHNYGLPKRLFSHLSFCQLWCLFFWDRVSNMLKATKAVYLYWLSHLIINFRWYLYPRLGKILRALG